MTEQYFVETENQGVARASWLFVFFTCLVPQVRVRPFGR